MRAIKKLISVFLFFVLTMQTGIAQDEVKKGWNLGLLPALGYDADLGLNLGVVGNLFNYGDGSSYPNYDHSLFLMGSYWTKGSADYILYFDSFKLVPGARFTGRASYNRNQKLAFYGFNGYSSNYCRDYENPDNEASYISRAFYRYDRKYLQLNADLQDTIGSSSWSWFAGWDMGWYRMGAVDVEHLNQGKPEDEQLPDDGGLYQRYVDWGLISDDEKDGGIVNSIKLGMVFDTRDRLTNPMKGVWTEFLFRWAPGFLGNGNYGHNKFSINHRQYFTIIPEDLSFAYRLWYDGTLGNSRAPYYVQPFRTASNYYEGLGGATTLRGILMNRVVGDDELLGNFELRWKFYRFRWIGQNFYLGLITFLDAGYIIDPIEFENIDYIPLEDQAAFFNLDENDGVHLSAGAGLKLVMNENFVITCDYGKAFNKQDGDGGLYIVLNYMF